MRPLIEVMFATSIVVMAVGFVVTMVQIPKELRGGIYAKIDDHWTKTNDRVDGLEKTFDAHMKELDKRQKSYVNQMKTICEEQKKGKK